MGIHFKNMFLKIPLRRLFRFVRRPLPPLNFITIHYAYFLGTCLASAVIFWRASTPFRSVSFTDALFLTTSAMTLAGLNTINLSTLNTFQQIVLFVLIMLGSAIFVSAFVVHVRKKAFESKFEHILEETRKRAPGPSLSISLSRTRSRSRSRSHLQTPSRPVLNTIKEISSQRTSLDQPRHSNNSTPTPRSHSNRPRGEQMRDISDIESSTVEEGRNGTNIEKSLSNDCAPTETPAQQYKERSSEHIAFDSEIKPPSSERISSRRKINSHHYHPFSMMGVGARSAATLHQRLHLERPGSSSSVKSSTPQSMTPRRRTNMYFSSEGMIARNSQFYNLTEAERKKLGGVEYAAVRFLGYLVPLYFILWQLLGCIALGAYVANKRPDSARRNGLNPWWVGAFNAVSAFNNSGMSLLDANMVAYQTSIYMLMTMGIMILAGNTCYPLFLRLLVWTMLKLMPKDKSWDEWRKTLRFLLDHPRRCYTNLFPAKHSWWLLLSVVSLNGIDWAAFEVLNIGNKAITQLPHGVQVLGGLFQALAVRSGGFYVVPISSVRVSLQVLYLVMMYISVYPVVITMRNSNVYEERSLGIYSDDPDFDENPGVPHTIFGFLKRHITGLGDQDRKTYFVRQQLRAQLAHDIWWLVLAVFLVMIIEGSQFERDPAVFSVFNVIFDTVSAYGCVGISVGLPYDAYSFCGSFHALSKLILCAVMVRGRHRGLPVAIDKAVLLPSEDLNAAEEEDAQIRIERSVSRGREA
ncbi:TrkH-domain-containing protein [Patellaria atrata CBS 101060]|uniref:Potassium transport protein n=1 Tax=Patellaria atrata CBS 101060 TaxID=1346257 RepID=A0A9P4SB15_9PEZI|nr:TrkH-domain-containing protein [Patellaria atrata CBS 101060]